MFNTPSWCDSLLAVTPPTPTVDDVVDEAGVLVGCLSVAVVVLICVDTDVRCLSCVADGFEELEDDEVEVVIVDCRPVGVEALTPDDVVVADVACRTGRVDAVADVVVDLSCRSCCSSVDDQC